MNTNTVSLQQIISHNNKSLLKNNIMQSDFQRSPLDRDGDIMPDFLLLGEGETRTRIDFLPIENSKEVVLRFQDGSYRDGYGYRYPMYFQTYEGGVYETSSSFTAAYAELFRRDVFLFRQKNDPRCDAGYVSWVKKECSAADGERGRLLNDITNQYFAGDKQYIKTY